MRHLLVMGGSSGIGLETVKLALTSGWQVRAFSRRADEMTLQHPNFKPMAGNALDNQDVHDALDGVDAVVQSLGVSLSPSNVLSGVSLFSKATDLLVEAMDAQEVKRLVAVTGFGTGDSKKAISPLLKPGFNLVFRRIYADKDVQERRIKASRLDWTIVRPGVLTSSAASGDYKVLTDRDDWRYGFISRADVADFICTCLEENSHIGEAPVLVG